MSDRLLVGMVAILAVTTALQPMFAPLHLALADHAHRYNPASGLFEDVIPAAESAAGDHSTFGDDGCDCAIATTTVSRSSATPVHTPCTVSNHSTVRYVATPFVCTDRFVLYRTVHTAPSGAAPPSACPIFMTAPKQSPPSTFG